MEQQDQTITTGVPAGDTRVLDESGDGRTTVRLVPTRLIPAAWEEVGPILKPAIDLASGRHTLLSTFDQLRSGHMQLFVAIRDDVARAAAVTQVLEYPSSNWLVVLFCAGKGLPDWGRDGIEAIEDWARRCGCSGVEIVGRAGWAMTLGYEKSASIIQKVLA
jgi:hypothetical protein